MKFVMLARALRRATTGGLAALALLAAATATAPEAKARVFIGFGFGFPGFIGPPIYAPPPPIVYAAPPIYIPPPVIRPPAPPVVYVPPPPPVKHYRRPARHPRPPCRCYSS
jgi:hypothetical protein